jgi:hypothetical protein
MENPAMTVVQPKLHPNPQLARAQWIDLRGPWGFAYDDHDRGSRECWQERDDVFQRIIEVPFPPESPASGVGDPSFHPIVWYRRTFTIPPEQAGERVVLHFGAVDYRASVWINGNLVAQHEGGQTPFSAEITRALQRSGDQVVVVRAEDLPGDLAQPRGKQDWRLDAHGIWYKRTTGIWQPVWIETHTSAFITSARWTPDIDRGMLGLAATLSPGEESSVRLRVRLTLHDVLLVDDVLTVHGDDVQRDMSLVAWSPQPHRRAANRPQQRRRDIGRSEQLRRTEELRDRGWPLPAQRAPVLSPHGARAGLLARKPSRRAER